VASEKQIIAFRKSISTSLSGISFRVTAENARKVEKTFTLLLEISEA
jgi:hypothetical protein